MPLRIPSSCHGNLNPGFLDHDRDALTTTLAGPGKGPRIATCNNKQNKAVFKTPEDLTVNIKSTYERLR
jgi:hypothetical protein